MGTKAEQTWHKQARDAVAIICDVAYQLNGVADALRRIGMHELADELAAEAARASQASTNLLNAALAGVEMGGE